MHLSLPSVLAALVVASELLATMMSPLSAPRPASTSYQPQETMPSTYTNSKPKSGPTSLAYVSSFVFGLARDMLQLLLHPRLTIAAMEARLGPSRMPAEVLVATQMRAVRLLRACEDSDSHEPLSPFSDNYDHRRAKWTRM
jgi:hypothetical protein